MDYRFLFYCFLSVVFITGGAFYLYSTHQEVTAAVYFLGATVATIFFGFRWFTSSGDLHSIKTSWPPVINYCPDLLTLATVNDEQVCIDTVGISQSGAMSTSDGSQVSEAYIFHLFLNQTGKTRVKSLCDQASSKEVTWEGVWDGSVCVGSEPPIPPKSASKSEE